MGNILGLFDGCDVEGISALVERLEKSSFDYLRLEGDGMSLVIGKNGDFNAECRMQNAESGQFGMRNAESGEFGVRNAECGIDGDGSLDAAEAETGSAVEKAGVEEVEGVFVIRAPSQGLFFAQPEPGAPPYVTVGASVKAGDTVGLMEIMKTYSALTAPVDGEVIAIHVVNEEYLEPEQALVSIRVKS